MCQILLGAEGDKDEWIWSEGKVMRKIYECFLHKYLPPSFLWMSMLFNKGKNKNKTNKQAQKPCL